jgi:hypothetical protein
MVQRADRWPCRRPARSFTRSRSELLPRSRQAAALAFRRRCCLSSEARAGTSSSAFARRSRCQLSPPADSHCSSVTAVRSGQRTLLQCRAVAAAGLATIGAPASWGRLEALGWHGLADWSGHLQPPHRRVHAVLRHTAHRNRSVRSGQGGWEPFAEHEHEVGGVDGFGDVCGGARVDAALGLVGSHFRGDGEDREVRA